MKPLSTFYYIKGNIGKILPLSVTVGLAAAFVYFSLIISQQLITNNEILDIKPFMNMSILSGTTAGVMKEEVKKDYELLMQSNIIEAWHLTRIRSVNYVTPTADHTMPLLFMNALEIQSTMNWQNIKLIKGKLPRNRMEIVLHQQLVKKYNLQLGDVIDKDRIGWNIDENLKVVGVFDGPALIGFGAEDPERLEQGDYGVVCLAGKGKIDAMNQFLEENYGNQYELTTYNRIENIVQKSKKAINGITIFLGIITLFTLSVLMGNICFVQYSLRIKEFEMLFAMGYSTKKIAWKVFREIGSSNGIGYLMGILLGILAGWFLNLFIIIDEAFYVKLIDVRNISIVLIIPTVVTIMGMIAPLKLIQGNQR